MRAAVITQPGTVEPATVEDPAPGPREVVVEVAATGLCGTDLHILQGEFAPKPPIIPGHEFAGEATALGSEVTELALGDQVAVAPAANCVRLPDHVDVQDAALIEPLSCAVRGYDVLRSRLASRVLVYGAGTMGLMMLQLAKATGAASVDVVDINAERLATAWIYNQEITITGSMAVLHSFERAVDLFATGVIDPRVFISDRLPLAAFPEVVARFQAGIGRKIQIQPGLATA